MIQIYKKGQKQQNFIKKNENKEREQLIQVYKYGKKQVRNKNQKQQAAYKAVI